MDATAVQTTTRFPLISKLLLGLGGFWLASLIMLLLSLLISAYGIPLASAIAGVTVIAATLALLLSVPLSWGLGCAGLILEWLPRHQDKRKRKTKQQSLTEDSSMFAAVKRWASAHRLAESRELGLKSNYVDPRQLRESELEMAGRPGSPRSGS